MLLGPGVNIKRSPLCGRNFEYFSEDPHLSGELAAACTPPCPQARTLARPQQPCGSKQRQQPLHRLRALGAASSNSEQCAAQLTLRHLYAWCGAGVEGVQSQGVGTSLKHFAANEQEAQRMVVDTLVDERTLREIYLAAFEPAVRGIDPTRPILLAVASPLLVRAHL